jgi:hypothetical protein
MFHAIASFAYIPFSKEQRDLNTHPCKSFASEFILFRFNGRFLPQEKVAIAGTAF